MKEIILLPTWKDVEQYLSNYTINALLISNASSMMQNKKYADLENCFSKQQLCSKFWIKDVLKNVVSVSAGRETLVVGAWYGMLISILDEKYKVTLTDIDETCIKKNKLLFSGVKTCEYTYKEKDMYDIDYSEYNFIINTSTEHVRDITEWFNLIPKNKYVLLQCTDFEHEQHISRVTSVEELLTKIKFNECLYFGTMHLPMYKRFMVIVKT